MVRVPLAAALFTIAMLGASDANAFEAKQTPSGKPVRWGTGTVELTISPSVDAIAPGAREALAIAIEGWSHTPHAPKLVLRDGDASARPGYDHVNLVYYAPDGFLPAGSALAVTVLTFDPETGEIVDADIVINGARGLELLAADARPAANAPLVSTEGGWQHRQADTAFDLAHVLAHETGHALGLRDEPNDVDALMFGYTKPGDASHRAPADDDAAGIAQSYGGAPIAAAPVRQGCSVGVEPKATWPGALVAASLVLIPMVRRRRLARVA